MAKFSRIPDSRSKYFPDFGIRISLHGTKEMAIVNFVCSWCGKYLILNFKKTVTHLKRTHEHFLFLLVFFILHTVERRVLSGSEFQGCSSHQLEVNCLYLLFNSHFKRAVRKKPAPQLSTSLCYYNQRQLDTQFSKPFKRIEAWTKQLTFLASMFFSQFRPRDVLQGIYLLSFHKLRIYMLKLKGQGG